MERSVDLPAPEGPMMEMNSPGCTSKVMRRSTYIRPAGVSKTFSRLRMAMSGPVMGAASAAASRDCVDEENKPMGGSRSADGGQGTGDGRRGYRWCAIHNLSRRGPLSARPRHAQRAGV